MLYNAEYCDHLINITCVIFTSILQELVQVSCKSDRDVIDTLKKEMDQIATSVKKSINDAKKEDGTDRKRELNEMEQRLNDRITGISHQIMKISLSEDYEFKNTKIRRYFQELVSEIDSTYTDLLDYLFQEDLLTFDDYERIQKQVTNMDKNRMLLMMVDQKGEEGVRILTDGLKKIPAMIKMVQLLQE